MYSQQSRLQKGGIRNLYICNINCCPVDALRIDADPDLTVVIAILGDYSVIISVSPEVFQSAFDPHNIPGEHESVQQYKQTVDDQKDCICDPEPDYSERGMAFMILSKAPHFTIFVSNTHFTIVPYYFRANTHLFWT